MDEVNRSPLTLEELNALPPDKAIDFFLACCGSTRWAKSMSECRPFWSHTVVCNAAEIIWQYLTPEDWREALRRRQPARPGTLTPEILDEMDGYETKFGYGFIIDPATPGANDLLKVIRQRFDHPLQYEIKVAAAEEGNRMRKEIRDRIRG